MSRQSGPSYLEVHSWLLLFSTALATVVCALYESTCHLRGGTDEDCSADGNEFNVFLFYCALAAGTYALAVVSIKIILTYNRRYAQLQRHREERWSIGLQGRYIGGRCQGSGTRYGLKVQASMINFLLENDSNPDDATRANGAPYDIPRTTRRRWWEHHLLWGEAPATSWKRKNYF